MDVKDFDMKTCYGCMCYTCYYNAHAKPDESCMLDGGRIQEIPIAKKCIGCSYCYRNQRQTQRSGCCTYKKG